MSAERLKPLFNAQESKSKSVLLKNPDMLSIFNGLVAVVATLDLIIPDILPLVDEAALVFAAASIYLLRKGLKEHKFRSKKA